MIKPICNLVVPGFPKSGTSSLHDYLNLHENICMSLPKEPHYFSLLEKWKLGTDHHNSLFQNGNFRFFGESSTTYCIQEQCISRIKNTLENPKIIIILRDPVDRLVSHYRWLYKLGIEKRPFVEAIKQSGHEFNPEKHCSGNYFGYIEFSSYSKYVPLWLQAFEECNVLIIKTEDLAVNPQRTLNTCFDFLDLKEIIIGTEIVQNSTGKTLPIKTNSPLNIIHKLAPRFLIDFSKQNPFLFLLWKRLYHGKHIQPPVLTEDDSTYASSCLQQDIAFYNDYQRQKDN